MKLYSLTGAIAHDDSEHGHFVPDEDGAFIFPGPLAELLHSAHVGKRKQWETEIERQERTHGEDLARRQDPATLYGAVAKLVELAQMAQGPAGDAPARPRGRRAQAPAEGE